MARKTAAELRAERTEAIRESNQAFWEEFKREYPRRFAQLMYDWSKFPELEVQQLEEVVYKFWSTSKWMDPVYLVVEPPEDYDWEYQRALENAEETVRSLKFERQEEERRWEVRRQALAKLTPEERELLNL